MKSTAAIRKIASAVALVSIPAFIKPVGAAGLFYFDDSCLGAPQAWIETALTRSIAVASRMQDEIYTDPQTKFAVTLFLQDDQPASSVVFNSIGGLTIAKGNAALRRPGIGDVVLIQSPESSPEYKLTTSAGGVLQFKSLPRSRCTRWDNLLP